MKFVGMFACWAVLIAGSAFADGTGDGRNGNFLLFPSWYEVKDIVAASSAPKERTEELPAPVKGKLHPYFGVDNFTPEAYLIPGNLLDVSGGIIYYVPRTGRTASLGMIFAIKDKVSNRLEGYAFDAEKVTPYVSLSVNY